MIEYRSRPAATALLRVGAQLPVHVRLHRYPAGDRRATREPNCNAGAVQTTTVEVRTGDRETVHDLTPECRRFARDAAGGGDGLLHVFVPHATAGVAILELGSGSDADLLSALDDLLPADDRWRHAHGSRGHGRSHVLPALVPPYATIPVVDGRPALGTWQSICVVDLNVDNEVRTVRLSLVRG